MRTADHRPKVQTTIRSDLGAIFISLELSRATWLITSLSPGNGEKMSKHSVRGGDAAALLQRLSEAVTGACTNDMTQASLDSCEFADDIRLVVFRG
jgi:hypothetical protein